MNEQVFSTKSESVDGNEQYLKTTRIELTQTLADAIKHLLSQQSYPIDNIRLQEVVDRHHNLAFSHNQSSHRLNDVIAMLQDIGIDDAPEVLKQPDAAFLPLLAYRADMGWGVIDSQTPQGYWNFRQEHSRVHSHMDG